MSESDLRICLCFSSKTGLSSESLKPSSQSCQQSYCFACLTRCDHYAAGRWGSRADNVEWWGKHAIELFEEALLIGDEVGLSSVRGVGIRERLRRCAIDTERVQRGPNRAGETKKLALVDRHSGLPRVPFPDGQLTDQIAGDCVEL